MKSLFDDVDDRLQRYINDYKLNVFDLAWLTDEEISYFKSDFKIIVEYLKAERTGILDDWGKQKVAHIHEMLDLLRAISRNDIFTKFEDDIYQQQMAEGGIKMNGFITKALNDRYNNGYANGVAFGRDEGIQIGIAQANLGTARNLLAMNMPIEQIAKATGLSYADIKSL